MMKEYKIKKREKHISLKKNILNNVFCLFSYSDYCEYYKMLSKHNVQNSIKIFS